MILGIALMRRMWKDLTLLAAMIDSLLFKTEEKNYNPVIILDSTSYGNKPLSYHFTFCDVQFFRPDSIINYATELDLKMNFLAANNVLNDISRYYKAAFNVLFLDSSSFHQLQGDDTFIYKNLYTKYRASNGFLILSRVGFDSNYHYAIVYIASHEESLSGWGRLVFLTKEQDRWIIKEMQRLWVS